MTKQRHGRWSLKNAFVDYVDARIAKAMVPFSEQIKAQVCQTVDAAFAKTDVNLADLSHQIEVRAQLATDEAITRVEQNITQSLDIRIQALLAELQRYAAYEAEARGQIAGLEAKSYADASLLSLSKAIAAIGRAMAQLSKRLDTLEQAAAHVPEGLFMKARDDHDEEKNSSHDFSEPLSDPQIWSAVAMTETSNRSKISSSEITSSVGGDKVPRNTSY
jgi:hypothetical protein